MSQTSQSSQGYIPFAASLVQYSGKEQVATPSHKDTGINRFLGLYELRTSLVYKATLIEFIGTTLITFTSCMTTISTLNYGFLAPPLLIATAHVIILSFFILATAKASGGHLNPMISFATAVAGMTTPARAVLYVVAQVCGAMVGAGLLKGVLNGEPFGLGGCALGAITHGRALLAEAVTCCVILFIAFGTALDGGQREVYGPVLGPFFVSTTLAIVIYMGGGIIPGYSGPSTNPARCFGPAVISGNTDGQWVFWVGPLIAGILIGLLYRFMPPGFNEVQKHAKPSHHEEPALGGDL